MIPAAVRCAVGSIALLASLPAQAIASDATADPAIAAAWARAWARLPDAWRAELGDVTWHRVADAGAPAGAPLEYELLSRAAYAYYSTSEERVYVTDHGAAALRRGALPGVDRVDDERRAEFVARLEDAPELVDPEAAWARFATAVAGFGIAGGDAPGLDPAATLTRLIRQGPAVALGGDVPLEQLLLHELAHAIQLREPTFFRRMAVWGTLSGWERSDDGRPSDGSWGGSAAIEEPIVLIRLLLDRPRGDSRYRPAATARFPNRYARYDLREDFAEAVRLTAYDPARLAAAAPEKLLYVNATGFVARLSMDDPGPLWIPAADLLAAPWRQRLVDGVLRLVAEDPELPCPDPRAVTAILRAHAAVLDALDPPAPGPAPAGPTDLPRVAGGFGVARFAVRIGDAVWHPSQRSLRTFWDDAVLGIVEGELFDARMEAILDATADDLARERAAIEALPSFDRDRLARSIRWLGRAHGVVEPAAIERFAAAERGRFAAADVPFAAVRLDLAAGRGADGAVAAAESALAAADPDGDAVDLARALVQAILEGDDVDLDRVAAAIAAIPGTTYGAARRVESWLATRARLVPPPTPDRRRSEFDLRLLNRAEDEARTAALPRLRTWLLELVRAERQR